LLDNQMEGIAQLDCLIGLSLGGNHQISDAVIKSLCMCTQLREIAVDGTDVTDHFLQEIVKLPFLKQLYITNTRITQEAVAFAKEQSSRIQVISKKLPSSKTRGNAVGSAVARYDYGGGCFEQTGNTTPKIWIEYKVGNIANFQFEEKHRTESEVSIFDKSRNFTIRFPRQGGMAQLSKDGEKTWKGLYMLSKSTNIVSRPPTNLLRSVDSKGGWQHTVLASSAGTMSQGSGAMVLETTRLGTEPWHVQVYSSSIRLEEGRSYRVILTAKSPTGVTAELIAGQAGGKYSEVGLRKRITLTPEYKTYEFSFVVEGQGIEKSRLGLHLGVAEGVVQVQSLALIPQ